jgi:Fe-S-cluster containining protein
MIPVPAPIGCRDPPTPLRYTPACLTHEIGIHFTGQRSEVMAKFDCDWCGKCCVSFGEFIKIERQLTDRDYYCRYGITGELFQVHVDPEFADEIEEEFIASDPKGTDSTHKGCIFMRKNPRGTGFACAIYQTRPTICRKFKCYRMLIHHKPDGEMRGKVIGINELRTHDEILAAIWKEKIAHLPHPFANTPIPAQHAHVSGASSAAHGHDSHIHAHIYDLGHGDDQEWESSVLSILAAHGYQGDPVEEEEEHHQTPDVPNSTLIGSA